MRCKWCNAETRKSPVHGFFADVEDRSDGTKVRMKNCRVDGEWHGHDWRTP